MQKPDIPQDEEIRLNTLRSLNILDTQAEERFDRLTRVAKRIFGVPIALVSLVDEHRQWFKSYFGLNARETPRDTSFCGHAILGDEVFVVTDASTDERFADNPLVMSEPNIRFYAGCPLRTPNGSKLGTLCIIDQESRDPTKEDIQILQDLAAMVENELAGIQLATLDELTRISNRRGFMMLAQFSLNLCVRQRIPASLVFIDLNKFKLINDTFGHAEGDNALTAFADQMQHTFRNSDIIARLGGDEFAVLLTNTSKKTAENIITKFRKSIENYNQETDRGYDIVFSYGIVEFNPDTHHTVESLLADGDSLMYKRKKQTSGITPEPV